VVILWWLDGHFVVLIAYVSISEKCATFLNLFFWPFDNQINDHRNHHRSLATTTVSTAAMTSITTVTSVAMSVTTIRRVR